MQNDGKIEALTDLEINSVSAATLLPGTEPIGFWDDWIPWIDPGKNPAVNP